MSEHRKPRHIRDIAHLYISRSQHRSRTPSATVWITGEHRRCFPALHVANLAAVLAVKNCPVDVIERSGLLPNAGYFMSLPPGEYIRWDEDSIPRGAGLGDVEIDCSPNGSGAHSRGTRRARIELFHLPPLDPPERFEDAARTLGHRAKSVRILVVLRTQQTSRAVPDRVLARFKPAAICTLRLSESSLDLPEGETVGQLGAERPLPRRGNDPACAQEAEPAADGADRAVSAGRACDSTRPAEAAPPSDRQDDTDTTDLGWVTGWEQSLVDRIPAVVRAPSSALSQSYRSAAEVILFKINDLGRKSDATDALGICAGIRSGLRHR